MRQKLALIFLSQVPPFSLLWPAVDAVCFETFGLSAGTFGAELAKAFGFKNEKSVPCCWGLGMPLFLVDGQPYLSIADGSATMTGTKWFGVYQLPILLSKSPSLDYRIFLASSLDMDEISDCLGLITVLTRQRYQNLTVGYN